MPLLSFRVFLHSIAPERDSLDRRMLLPHKKFLVWQIGPLISLNA
jgi:hypothetical protein